MKKDDRSLYFEEVNHQEWFIKMDLWETMLFHYHYEEVYDFYKNNNIDVK